MIQKSICKIFMRIYFANSMIWVLFLTVVFISTICSIYKYIIYTDKLDVGYKRRNENIPKTCFEKSNFVIHICGNIILL